MSGNLTRKRNWELLATDASMDKAERGETSAIGERENADTSSTDLATHSRFFFPTQPSSDELSLRNKTNFKSSDLTLRLLRQLRTSRHHCMPHPVPDDYKGGRSSKNVATISCHTLSLATLKGGGSKRPVATISCHTLSLATHRGEIAEHF